VWKFKAPENYSVRPLSIQVLPGSISSPETDYFHWDLNGVSQCPRQQILSQNRKTYAKSSSFHIVPGLLFTFIFIVLAIQSVRANVMLNEIGGEDLVGKLIRLVLSLVVARFRPSNDGNSVSKHRIERLTFIHMIACCPV
jgi:hypothetical protein